MIDNLLVIGQLPPPIHGSNVMAKRFMDALAANRITSVIVEKTFSKQLHEIGRISLRKLLKVPSLYLRVSRAIVQHKPQCCVYFISAGLTSLLVDCLILSRLRAVHLPYILYFHGTGYRTYDSHGKGCFKSIVRRTLCNALGGLVLGECLKNDVNHCIDNGKLFVLPNGIPPIQNTQLYQDRDDKDLKVVFLSNLIPAKGPEVFLNVAREIHEHESHVKFIMAGKHTSENYLAKLNTYIKQNRLEGVTSIVGPVYGEDKERFFQEATIMVFPTYKETFGIVNIEAMMWGIPVVTSPIGAIPEVVRNGVNGYIVDPNDIPLLVERVLFLIRNHRLRQEMGRVGKELFYKNYSIEAYTHNITLAFEFFDKLLYEQDMVVS